MTDPADIRLLAALADQGKVAVHELAAKVGMDPREVAYRLVALSGSGLPLLVGVESDPNGLRAAIAGAPPSWAPRPQFPAQGPPSPPVPAPHVQGTPSGAYQVQGTPSGRYPRPAAAAAGRSGAGRTGVQYLGPAADRGLGARRRAVAARGEVRW